MIANKDAIFHGQNQLTDFFTYCILDLCYITLPFTIIVTCGYSVYLKLGLAEGRMVRKMGEIRPGRKLSSMILTQKGIVYERVTSSLLYDERLQQVYVKFTSDFMPYSP